MADAANLDSGLAGRGVIVTGAGSQIGYAVCGAFAAAGAVVFATDVTADSLAETRSALPGSGHRIEAADLADPDHRSRLVRSATEELGNLWALVHLAAAQPRCDHSSQFTDDDWEHRYGTNLEATYFLARAVAEHLKVTGRGGRLVLLSSRSWQSGGVGKDIADAATNGWITTLSRGLARTYGPHAITVNCVAPGVVETTNRRNDRSDRETSELIDAVPLGRLADPSEIANVFVYLASTHASFVSGASLNVTGGALMY